MYERNRNMYGVNIWIDINRNDGMISFGLVVMHYIVRNRKFSFSLQIICISNVTCTL